MTRKSGTSYPGRILVVDDEPDMASGLKQYLSKLGHTVEAVGDAESAVERLEGQIFDLVLTDLMLPGADGIDLLERIKRDWPNTIVILFTGFATVETAVQAIRKGAFDYIPKPFTPQQLEVVVERALKQKALADENRNLRGQIRAKFSFDKLLGCSDAMKQVRAFLARIAPTDANVLVCGESGTGKEMIARALHANSRRQNKPFVPLDCAALPLNLLESELFGYEKGAFTGAVTSRPGLLESAHGGTFFMDEIGELDPAMQVKLLRVLQERQFRRIGGSRQISVDVRFIAATNRNLKDEVEQGRFRADLYHRLNVIQIELPPLRERHGDVPLLAAHFLNRYGERLGKTGLRLSPRALRALEAYHWPGNVRELQNAMEYAASLGDGPEVDIQDLPLVVQEALRDDDSAEEAWGPGEGEAAPVPRVHHELPYKVAKRKWLEVFERVYFTELLRRHDFNISHAARSAGIDRKSIQRILKKNNLDIDRMVGEN